MFECVIIPFPIIACCRWVMFQKQYFELTKMGGHKKPLGGTPPWLPRSDGTDNNQNRQKTNAFSNVCILQIQSKHGSVSEEDKMS